MGNQFPASQKPATIQDVARIAGVSKGTVSKYLNSGSGYYVSATTRKKIEEVIAELDFQPNAIAQGLTQNRTKTIGLIAADIRNPFYPDLVVGVEDVVEPAGFTLLLGSSKSDPRKEASIVRSMIRRRVDGLILSSVRMNVSEISVVVKSGIPLVLASRNLREHVADTVIVDNVAGAKLAVEHLYRLGHRRIGHVAGPLDVTPFLDRLRGYREGLQEAGLQLDESLITSVGSSPEEGAKAARMLLDRPDRPTALFVANDNMALGVLDAASELGLDVPGDVSIVGFDNISIAGLSALSLTTVDSDARWLGQGAARLLLSRIERNAQSAEQPPVLTVHPARLIVRRTSGYAPAKIKK